ncbi:uncharacterized protein A4U43_C04F34320 [Asparagus officinalis]|uniref:ATP-dependent Clp protease proteolytic subunit n=1 Tax=Asparagus officinalis TaxID=4686 RepID=A0A5P1F5N7_ASPOF|nr:uncharacterized protein A4U43_C04F34320 [Asparagus officinalis]
MLASSSSLLPRARSSRRRRAYRVLRPDPMVIEHTSRGSGPTTSSLGSEGARGLHQRPQSPTTRPPSSWPSSSSSSRRTRSKPLSPLHQLAARRRHAGLAIYDTMQYIRSPSPPLRRPGRLHGLPPPRRRPARRAASLPNARVMIHQPSGGATGQATDIAIHAKEILKVRERLNAIYAKHTGQSLERIEGCMERDLFMSPDEAKEFGIVDEVIEHRPIALVSDAVEGGEKEGKGKDEGSSP